MHFKSRKIHTQNKDFIVLEALFTPIEVKKAITQAQLKSQYTNNADQNTQKRTAYKKFVMQFEGILGEMAITKMLSLSFQKEDGCKVEVRRWDDVRTDGFKSPKDEYDILIQTPHYTYYIESRASVNYKFIFTQNTLHYMDTIGKYSNTIKTQEKKSDFYIRPLFQLKEPHQQFTLNSFDFYKLFMEGGIALFITGGCSKSMMYGQDSIIKSMGQNKTTYQTLSILKGWDAKELLINIKSLLCKKENR